MGFLWDLVQHSQIREQGERTGSLEGRVAALERNCARRASFWLRR